MTSKKQCYQIILSREDLIFDDREYNPQIGIEAFADNEFYIFTENRELAEKIRDILIQSHYFDSCKIWENSVKKVEEEFSNHKIYKTLQEFYYDSCKEICKLNDMEYLGNNNRNNKNIARINTDNYTLYFKDTNSPLLKNERIVDFDLIIDLRYVCPDCLPRTVNPNNYKYEEQEEIFNPYPEKFIKEFEMC